jgi:HlyD family secretion protein
MSEQTSNSTVVQASSLWCWKHCWCLFALLLVCLFTGASGCAGKPSQADAAKDESKSDDEAGIAVHAQPAEVRTIAVTVEGLGRCQALPDRIAAITPAIEGRVERILASVGQQMKQGQAIVQLDTRIAQANLAEKTAARDGLQASLDLLKAPPRAEELKGQELAVEQAVVACDKAQAAADRLRPLFAKGEIPAGQMNDAEVAVKQAMIGCNSARAQLQAMRLGPRPEAVAEAEAHVKSAQAQVDSAQAQLDLLTLKAPIDGVLDSLNCQIGQTVAIGTTIGQVVDSWQLQVVVWLPPSKASRASVGQTVHITDNGIKPDAGGDDADDDEDAVEGKVTFVGHVVDPQTGNLPVQITIDNSDGKFAVGASVAASIVVEEVKDVLAVPESALVDVGEGTVINVVRDGKSARLEPKLGVHDNKWVEVSTPDAKAPLKAGEMVIVDGGYNLPDATAVTIAADAADDEAGGKDAKGDAAKGDAKSKDDAKGDAAKKADPAAAAEGAKP